MKALISAIEEYARKSGMRVVVYAAPNNQTPVCVYLTNEDGSLVLTICDMGKLLYREGVC